MINMVSLLSPAYLGGRPSAPCQCITCLSGLLAGQRAGGGIKGARGVQGALLGAAPPPTTKAGGGSPGIGGKPGSLLKGSAISRERHNTNNTNAMFLNHWRGGGGGGFRKALPAPGSRHFAARAEFRDA